MKGIKTKGIKDECPLQSDVYNNKEECWCCEECRKSCRDSI